MFPETMQQSLNDGKDKTVILLHLLVRGKEPHPAPSTHLQILFNIHILLRFTNLTNTCFQ